MKKMVAIIGIAILFTLGIKYIADNHRFFTALTPTICWIDLYAIDIQQLEIMNPLDDVNKNTQKNDYRFICFLGMGYSFPGIDFEKNINNIAKYGSKLVCGSDIIYDKEDTKKSLIMYHYIKKYNTLLLKKIPK